MPDIMTKDATAIADKLLSKVPTKAGRTKFSVTKKQGKEHLIIQVSYKGTFVGQYGIQRGSKEQRHNYVAEQLHLTRKQGYNLAKCPFSVDDFLDALDCTF